jgi:hypothetical protein
MRYFLLVLLFALVGCRIVAWGTVYSALSPDGNAELQVREKGCFADCAVQIAVKRGWRTEQIARNSDCWITFVHAAWEGDIVSVFVDGGYCGQIKVAFDTKSHSPVDFRSTEKWLSNSIIRAYGVTRQELQSNKGDVFLWATYPGDGEPRRSMDEFRRRHPGL